MAVAAAVAPEVPAAVAPVVPAAVVHVHVCLRPWGSAACVLHSMMLLLRWCGWLVAAVPWVSA